MAETPKEPAKPKMRERFVDQYDNEYEIAERTGDLKMGRDSRCDICIPPIDSRDREDPPPEYLTVSRAMHAIFNVSEKTIRDNGSRCGIKINGRAVYSGDRRHIENGDRITLGDLNLIYRHSADNTLFGKINEETIAVRMNKNSNF